MISGLALVVTIGWNLHNHRRTTVATKLARFERHVAVPLNQLLLDLDDAADLAAVLADPKSSPLESRKRQVSEELYRRVLMLQKRLV
ncbi:hypothetical protein, partial [Rhodopirellula bahusiensis]|uniref:hypothetical protein n=1 Tax=Rhodopirellula bahusiensis TaxID=2014065 RepID=UPI003265D009